MDITKLIELSDLESVAKNEFLETLKGSDWSNFDADIDDAVDKLININNYAAHIEPVLKQEKTDVTVFEVEKGVLEDEILEQEQVIELMRKNLEPNEAYFKVLDAEKQMLDTFKQYTGYVRIADIYLKDKIVDLNKELSYVHIQINEGNGGSLSSIRLVHNPKKMWLAGIVLPYDNIRINICDSHTLRPLMLEDLDHLESLLIRNTEERKKLEEKYRKYTKDKVRLQKYSFLHRKKSLHNLECDLQARLNGLFVKIRSNIRYFNVLKEKVNVLNAVDTVEEKRAEACEEFNKLLDTLNNELGADLKYENVKGSLQLHK